MNPASTPEGASRAPSGAGAERDTSVRELTPHGHGAVSVLRIHGPRATAVVRVLSGGHAPRPGAPRLVRLRAPDSGSDVRAIDEALVCAHAEDDVEVHVHASPIVVREVIAALEAWLDADPTRARGAKPGTARAPSPCDLVEAHALERLASAPSEAGARILLDQAEGAWRAFVQRVADDRIDVHDWDRWLERSRAARAALRPLVVLLAGPVNAGKSTLFNALVGEERAITSAVAGTTRDLVRAFGSAGDYPVEFVDSAGERLAADDEVEHAGIARARRERERADVVLWLIDAEHAADPAAPGDAERVSIVTRVDRIAPERARILARERPVVSARADPAGARAVVAELLRARAGLPRDAWVPGAAAAIDDATFDRVSGWRALAPDERRAAARAHLGVHSARDESATPRT